MCVQSEGCLAMLAVMPFLVLVVEVGCPVMLYVECMKPLSLVCIPLLLPALVFPDPNLIWMLLSPQEALSCIAIYTEVASTCP